MGAARQFMSGNCKITIMDDCVVKTREETEDILKSLSDIYAHILIRKGQEKETELFPDRPFYKGERT